MIVSLVSQCSWVFFFRVNGEVPYGGGPYGWGSTSMGRKCVAVFFLRVFLPRMGLPLALRPTNMAFFLFLHSADAYVLYLFSSMRSVNLQSVPNSFCRKQTKKGRRENVSELASLLHCIIISLASIVQPGLDSRNPKASPESEIWRPFIHFSKLFHTNAHFCK